MQLARTNFLGSPQRASGFWRDEDAGASHGCGHQLHAGILRRELSMTRQTELISTGKIGRMSHRTTYLLFLGLLTSGIPMYAQASPPFFAFWVGGTAAADVPIESVEQCFSSDGNVPSYASVPVGLTNCLKSRAPSFSATRSFTSQGLSMTATMSGNQTGIAVELNLSPAAYYNTGMAETIYAQQYMAPPNSMTNVFTFTVSGANTSVTFSVSSDCPAGESNCSLYSASGGDFYASPPGNYGQMLAAGPIRVGPSGLITVRAQVLALYDAFEPPSFGPTLTGAFGIGCAPLNVSLAGNGTPTISGFASAVGGLNLTQSAGVCGYQGYDWQQYVTNLPCPNPFTLAVAPSSYEFGTSPGFCHTAPTPGSLAAGGAAGSFLDPPGGGYGSPNKDVVSEPPGNPQPLKYPYNPAPFYWDEYSALNTGVNLPLLADGTLGFPVNVDNNTKLIFLDTPDDPCLNQASPLCSNVAATGDLGFTTNLVYIDDSNSEHLGPTLLQFTWTDNVNGTGIAGLQGSGSGSGPGYITITSINGVPVPPIVPTSQIAATSSGLAYSRVTQTFNGTVTIKNVGTTTITTPSSFQLVLAGLPDGVSLANAEGVFNLNPYVTVLLVTAVAPGQSISVPVQFYNPNDVAIRFTPEFYAGTF